LCRKLGGNAREKRSGTLKPPTFLKTFRKFAYF
jgi:hypothetical protein